MTRILVAEDDPFGRRYLETTLRDAGWTVTAVADGQAAWEAYQAADHGFDVVLTDVRMPGLSGIDLVLRIRELDQAVALIVISAIGSEAQVVAGLEAGADDYLSKPVSGPVVVAKIRGALRRADGGRAPRAEPVLEVGPLRLDVAAGVATKDGQVLSLTRTESSLLEYMMRNGRRIISPAQILGSVWGEAYEADTEILRVAILRLRRKLEDDPAAPVLLRTHVGLGYSLGLPG